MKQLEAKQLIPDKSYVRYAGGKYKVAEISTMPGNAIFIGIYDEPPSLHVDYLNADNVEFVKEWLDESPTSTDTGQGKATDEEIVNLVKSVLAEDSKNEKSEKSYDAGELKSDVKEREETLQYIRDVMERNNFTEPGQMYRYWNDKHIRMEDTFRKLEQSDTTPTSHTEELSTPPVRVKGAEEVLLNHLADYEVEFLGDKTGNITKAMKAYASQFTPHKEGYSVEDMEEAVELIKEALSYSNSIGGWHDRATQFLNQLKK